MSKLKYVTETSYVIINEFNNYDGVMIEKSDGAISIYFKDRDPKEYESREFVKQEYGDRFFDDLARPEENEKEKGVVGRWPTNIVEPFIVDIEKGYFKKSKSAKVLSAAGYYAIRFPSGWIRMFCPTVATLEKVAAYEGPFDTKMEMNSVLTQAKNREESK